MSRRRPSELINYSVRANKNVERKLIVGSLAKLGRKDAFPITKYQYVGMGSVWFSDFILMHKLLGIKDMLSIEGAVSKKKRVAFNSPYANIKIKIGNTSDVIPQISWEGKKIVWLDYESALRDSVFSDIEKVVRRISAGSIFLMTANAEVAQLRMPTEDETTPEQALRLIAGNVVPPNAEERLTANGFPGLVGEILGNKIQAVVLAERTDLEFAKLFNFSYADGATMVTYGGIFLNEKMKELFLSIEWGPKFDFVVGTVQTKIAVPHLTIKEKLQFDKFLPADRAPSIKELGFELQRGEIEQYCKYYLFYPVFGEMQP